MPGTSIERTPEATIAWERSKSIKKSVAEALGNDGYVHLGGSGNREWLQAMDLVTGEATRSTNRWVFRAIPSDNSFHVEPAGNMFRSPPGGVNLTVTGKSFLSFITPVIFAVKRGRSRMPTRFEWVPGWEWVSWFLLPEVVRVDDTSAKIGRTQFGKGILNLKGRDYSLLDWGVVGLLKSDTKFDWSLLGREVTFEEVGHALVQSIASLNVPNTSQPDA